MNATDQQIAGVAQRIGQASQTAQTVGLKVQAVANAADKGASRIGDAIDRVLLLLALDIVLRLWGVI